MKRWILPAVLATLLPARMIGQPAGLVEDLVPSNGSASASPRDFLTLGDRVFFLADSRTSLALWVTDGSPEGTRLLADLCPSRCAGATLLGSANGLLFLTASTLHSSDPPLLWRSDGTRGGTFPLAELDGDVALARDKVFFRGSDATRGSDLWVSDGTPQGTGPVPDAEPGPDSNPIQLTAIGNRVFYIVPSNDDGLWVSDGTAGGSTLVLDDFSHLLSAAGNRLFFLGSDEDGGELWVSDGTPAGTRKVSQFETEGPFEPTEWIKPVGSQVYFLADDRTHGVEIWRSDGTLQGTRRATEIGFHQAFAGDMSPEQMEVAGSRLVFVATDGLHGFRIWTAGAKPETTAPLEQGCPGGECPSLSGSERLLRVGNRVLFLGRDEAHGKELWSTDGTAAGTRLLGDFCQGPCDAGDLQGPWPLLGVAFFSYGGSLWRSDGTPAGTRPVTDHRPFFAPGRPAALGGRFVFAAADEVHGRELWINDGTPAGTRMLADLVRAPLGTFPEEITLLGGGVVFRGTFNNCPNLFGSHGQPEDVVQLTSGGDCFFGMPSWGLTRSGSEVFYWWHPRSGAESPSSQIWATNGIPGGNRQVSSFPRHFGRSPIVPFQGNLYTVLSPEGGGQEVWKAGPGGTAKAFDLFEQVEDLEALSALGSRLYFVTESAEGYRLWVSGGGPSPVAIATFENGLARVPRVRAGAWDYFLVVGDFGEALWRTDGTSAGTVRLAELRSDIVAAPAEFAEHQGALYFFGRSIDSSSWGLWRSDGTPAGTGMLFAFPQPEPDELLPEAASFQGHLYFAVDDGVHGRELWRSDGTSGGTAMVRDLYPGIAGSGVADLTAAGGRLFFTANDGIHGNELWQTDGTVPGTRLVHDVAPLAESSHPGNLTAAGDKLFFAADDGLTGRELWVLPLAGGGCRPSETALCLSQGRFKIEVSWRDFQGNSGTGKAVPLTADTGYFWFFGAANVEVVVKVLNGQGLNGHHWVFYGALSSVEYTLTVTDTQTGLTRRYFNPMNQLASVGDTTGFGPLGAFSSTPPAPALRSVAPATGICEPSATRLCLQGGRFAVEAEWKDFAGKAGKGQAVGLTVDTGYLWFFDAANVEVVVKVLDGRGLNGRFWVFYGALSSVEYSLKVTDTQTGEVRTYKNPSGRLASSADTEAF